MADPVEQQPEPAQPACSSCFYFRGSLCKRYPAPQRVPADHWCGDFTRSPAFRCVFSFPPGETVVGVAPFRDGLICTTTHAVYRVEHDELTEVRLSPLQE